MYDVCCASEMAEIDSWMINEIGIPSVVLMENAGQAVVSAMFDYWGMANVCESGPVAVVCGTGNNGADGLVVARKLVSYGATVDVFIIGKYSEFRSEEGKCNLKILKKFCKSVRFEVIEGLNTYSYIVDALLGGLGVPDKIVCGAISMINAARGRVVSVDVPSGCVHATDTCVRANLTVTFGAIKSEILFYPGNSFVGKLVFAPISFIAGKTSMRLISVPKLPIRDPNGHKGSFGKGLLMCGSAGYFGAPLFTTRSFLKSGGGYAFLHCKDLCVQNSIAVTCPEIVTRAFDGEVNVAIVGPGIGVDNVSLFQQALATRCDCGLVIDGDALTILSSHPDMWSCLQQKRRPVILTPHLGELGRLFPATLATENFYEKILLVKQILSPQDDEVIIVMKGSRTAVLSNKNPCVYINVTGNSGMATPGSGDVLVGIIAALLCAKTNTHTAVCNAVFIHGLAGDIAKETCGEDGMLASDIMEAIPAAIIRVRTDPESVARSVFPSRV